jgi:predicted Fe-Mo cluster-binding NifX family protein
MARIAIPIWNGRVSPVFDAASRLLVVEVGPEGEYNRFETDVSDQFLPSKAMRLTGLEVDILICGAISRPLSSMVTTAGIRLIPWISGQVEEVLQAFLRGELPTPQFIMPGCTGQWHRGPDRGFGRGMGRRRRRGQHFP